MSAGSPKLKMFLSIALRSSGFLLGIIFTPFPGNRIPAFIYLLVEKKGRGRVLPPLPISSLGVAEEPLDFTRGEFCLSLELVLNSRGLQIPTPSAKAK